MRRNQEDEGDFFARMPNGKSYLIQTCVDVSSSQVVEREGRARICAYDDFPNAEPILLVLEPPPMKGPLPQAIRLVLACEWFLSDSV